MDFVLFLGRFHHLVEDLSIGFILLVAIFEVFNRLNKDKFYNLDTAISIFIFWGGISSALLALKRLYHWQTNVTPEGVDKLNEEFPGVKIISVVNGKTYNAGTNE